MTPKTHENGALGDAEGIWSKSEEAQKTCLKWLSCLDYVWTIRCIVFDTNKVVFARQWETCLMCEKRKVHPSPC